MREVLHQYFNIAFLMGKPQDLPAGGAQVRLGVVLAFVTYVLALAVPFGIERAVIQAFVDLAATALVMWVALTAVGHAARFEQSFGGFCGASAFINMAAVPMYLTRGTMIEADGGSMGTLPDFVLLVWGLSLLAHVIRHTFEVKMAVSVLISFLFFLLLSSVMAVIMPLSVGVPADSVSWDTKSSPSIQHSRVTQLPTSGFEMVPSDSRMI